MAWFDTLSDPAELRRCSRDLISLATLPATWSGLSPAEICESTAAVLGSALDAEIICILLPSLAGAAAIQVAHARPGSTMAWTETLRRSLADWLDSDTWPPRGQIESPFGGGRLQVVACAIRIGTPRAVVVAVSSRPGFPLVSDELLLDLASDEVAIALNRWRYEAAQRRYQSLVERFADLVGLADMDGAVRYMNPAGLVLLGLTDAREVQGRHIMEFVAETDRESAETVAWPQVLRLGGWSGEIHLLNFATGEAIPFAMEWFVINDPQTGGAMNMATVSRDLRPQRKAESELRTLNETLEQRLEDGMADLALVNSRLQSEIAEHKRADTRLHDMQLELFHASRLSAAGQMAAALAHELSQPLLAATNSLEAVRRLLAPGDARRQRARASDIVDDALDQIRRAGDIIERMRHFVRPGKAQRQVEDIKAILDDSIALAMLGAEALGISVTIEPADGALRAYADRIQIQQVMVNLIRNAVEAMGQSLPRDIRISVAESALGAVEIAVADTGPGLSHDMQDRLFEPFQTTKSDGMGLGLAIAHSIVEAHGGMLTAVPNKGGGTVFKFTLEAGPSGVK